MAKKYELTNECKEVDGHKLYRIRALKAIPKHRVEEGDLGGWIESERNLSHERDAWVGGDAMVWGNACVHGDAKVCGNAKVFGNAMVLGESCVCRNARVCGDARVYGNACVYGKAKVSGNAEVSCDEDYMVFKNTWSSRRWFTYTSSNKKWTVGCFHGTGEELIKKAFADSEISGRCYEAIVKAVEQIERDKAELATALGRQSFIHRLILVMRRLIKKKHKYYLKPPCNLYRNVV